MRWAVIGSSGMLGSDLIRTLRGSGEYVVGFARGELDFSKLSLEQAGAKGQFDIVVNCAAFTRVDQAETQIEEATFTNATLPQALSSWSQREGTRLIHISTDYVFDGDSSLPYRVDSPTYPQSVYGQTKLDGEGSVLESPNGLVVRTGWLYGANGSCFPKTIASKLLSGGVVKVVSDQVGSPTWALNLSRFIKEVAKTWPRDKIMHGVSSGSASRFSFAQEIARSMDRLVPDFLPSGIGSYCDLIEPIDSEHFPKLAKRPKYSVLEPTRIDEYQIPNWKDAWGEASDSIIRSVIRDRPD
jgi:dTDP-4-dehydrorhamnose reductase